MKTYKIPVIWTNWGIMEIEATNLKEAKRIAKEEAELPDGNYIDESFEIDEENITIFNKGE